MSSASRTASGHNAHGHRPTDTGGDIAVVVPLHVAQAGAVSALFNGLPDVLVGTANGLQGLEVPPWSLCIRWPGYRTAEPFALDRGRMCVTLSRHWAHLSILVDPATALLLKTTARTNPDAGHALAVSSAL